MADEAYLWSRFFLAVPEAALEDALIDYLRARGVINKEALENIHAAQKAMKKLGRIQNKLRGKSLIGRLLAVAPEILSRGNVDVMARFGLIEKPDAELMKMMLRFGALGKGGPAKPSIILQRLRNVFGFGFANDALNFSTAAGFISEKEAGVLKAGMLGGQSVAETIQSLRNAKNAQNVMMLLANGVINQRNINAMRLAGLLDNRTANAVLEALDYGGSLWTVFEGSRKFDGYAARLAYSVSGTFSHEAMDVLKAVNGMTKADLERMGIGWIHGKLTPERMLLLEMATAVSQRFNRQMMEQMTNRRYRVVPGESPIVSFARSTKMTEDDILQLLGKSADDARRRARLLAGSARGAEYNLRARALHQAMRQVWEGSGFLTIFGEHDVADAAYESAVMLEKRFYDKMPQEVAQMLQFQAKSGLDSFISRKENTQKLSRLVYGNFNLWSGKVDQQVNMGLLQGQSADEIAKRVANLINPNVPGGVRYAATRIGRTEIANAFHQTTIRHNREAPWVKGFKWNKSKSHAHSDICDEYAGEDHDGLGPGVFKKANVPDKPHPQCMCFVTAVSIDDDTFIKYWNKGYFNQYLASRMREPAVDDSFWGAIRQTGLSVGGKAVKTAALSATGVALERMVRSGGPHISGFNFKDLVGKPRNVIAAKIAEMKTAYTTNKGLTKATGEVVKPSDVPEKVVKKVEKQLTAEEAALLTRQKTFKALQDQYAARAKFYKNNEADFNDNEDYFFDFSLSRPGMKPEFAEKYYDVFDGENGRLGNLRFDALDEPIERMGKALYGQASYRTVNARLRLTNGDLGLYDEMFGDGEQFFTRSNNIIKNGLAKKELNNAAMNQHFLDSMEADAQHSASDFFGNRFEDISTYYDELLQLGTGFFHGQNDHWKNAFERVKKHSDIVESIDATMLPSKRDMFTFRVSGVDWMGLDRLPTADDVGRVFKDDAYISTEGLPNYFEGGGGDVLDFGHRPVRYQIFNPKGTMMTRFNASEYELGLSRGTKFQVVGVEGGGRGFAKTVHLAVIDQDNVWDEAKQAFSAKLDDDMWDQIMGDF